MKKYCSHPLVLIEGNPFETDLHFDPLAIKGALISIKSIRYVPVLYCQSIEETKETLLMIGRQEENRSEEIPQRGGYRPKRLKSRQLYVLQGFPSVGPALARKMLNHFGSVSRIMNATLEDLMEVDGMGKKSAQAIRDVLDREWVKS